jgi:hypothetical protein
VSLNSVYIRHVTAVYTASTAALQHCLRYDRSAVACGATAGNWMMRFGISGCRISFMALDSLDAIGGLPDSRLWNQIVVVYRTLRTEC